MGPERTTKESVAKNCNFYRDSNELNPKPFCVPEGKGNCNYPGDSL